MAKRLSGNYLHTELLFLILYYKQSGYCNPSEKEPVYNSLGFIQIIYNLNL